ncbi:MAG: DNA polymerase III subunit delta [uncultured bacterium]|nr:MAG: DNA polymerase III subunit delta [uncultured bacterium]
MIFSWQQDQWQYLWQAKQSNRLPHALLFAGIKGTGKAIFADHFSRALLCQHVKADGKYCGQCHACHLVAGRVHPNVYWVEPEKAGQAIKIDQIRMMNEFIYQSSFDGNYRIAIIDPADAMNVNAANALLKTLEEPASGALMILIANEAAILPATILSRCQRVLFPCPSRELAISWLQTELKDKSNVDLLLSLTHGAPLAAKNLSESNLLQLRVELLNGLSALIKKSLDPLGLTNQLQGIEAIQFVDYFLSFLTDLLQLQLAVSQQAIINTDFNQELNALKSVTNSQSNLSLYQHLLKLRKQINLGINLNKQLLIEDIIIQWMRCAA